MPPFTKADYIWLNGNLTSWDTARVHVTAHALQYGTGVFEGMRCYDTADGPAIFRLDAHMKRFAESARHYEIQLPYSLEQLSEASLEVVRANGLENAYLRPLAFFDSYSFSVWPKDCPVTVTIIAVPGRQYLQGGPEQGVRVTVSLTHRIDETILLPYVKACGHYTNSVRAVQEAMRKGYDEAILLNTKGDVAEGSGANLFVVRNGELITNDVDQSIVMGITRDSVIRIARDLGIAVTIRPITLDDLRSADELFFSGTAIEVTPIKELDGRVLGDGTPGPVTRHIQKTYFDAVHGRLPQYQSWLAYVNRHTPGLEPARETVAAGR
ncbi:MAG TPA: branched-chain amino acid transaminase [Gemmatimonadaceae bacterium]|nr:branched-chain amino acid transaminase [Gemmatimonadaceae bacterium]